MENADFALVTAVSSVSNTPERMYPCSLRDGGLKRSKVNDAFKEELQKLYSKVLVGDHEDESERMEI